MRFQKFLRTFNFNQISSNFQTLLVVFITFQRFLVVWFPLRYARNEEKKFKRIVSFSSSISTIRKRLFFKDNLTIRRNSSSVVNDQLDTSNGHVVLMRTLSEKIFQRKTTPSIKTLLQSFFFPSLKHFNFLFDFHRVFF